MEEIWKDIKGFEGLYQISSMGNVASLHFGRKGNFKNRPRKLLKPILKSIGYYVVGLQGKQKFVHRLVAEAFIPNPENKPNIDHINTITTDNTVNNLRWCTQYENLNNPISKKRRIESIMNLLKGKTGKDSLIHRCVFQYNLNGEFLRKWDCMLDACREYDIDSGSMTKNCQGLQSQAKGFIWSYTYKNKVKPATIIKKSIVQLDEDMNVINEFSSVSEAAKFHNTSTGRICSCLKGITNTCKGYKWKYK